MVRAATWGLPMSGTNHAVPAVKLIEYAVAAYVHYRTTASRFPVYLLGSDQHCNAAHPLRSSSDRQQREFRVLFLSSFFFGGCDLLSRRTMRKNANRPIQMAAPWAKRP